MGIKASVWWPGWAARSIMSNLLKGIYPHREPLMYSTLPNHQWEKAGLNALSLMMIHWNPKDIFYQLLSFILALKATFSRHRVPATLVRDNGPQYTHLKTNIPQPRKAFAPDWPHLLRFWEKDKDRLKKTEIWLWQMEQSQELYPIPDNQPILVQTGDSQVAIDWTHIKILQLSSYQSTPGTMLKFTVLTNVQSVTLSISIHVQLFLYKQYAIIARATGEHSIIPLSRGPINLGQTLVRVLICTN